MAELSTAVSIIQLIDIAIKSIDKINQVRTAQKQLASLASSLDDTTSLLISVKAFCVDVQVSKVELNESDHLSPVLSQIKDIGHELQYIQARRNTLKSSSPDRLGRRILNNVQWNREANKIQESLSRIEAHKLTLSNMVTSLGGLELVRARMEQRQVLDSVQKLVSIL